MAEETVEQLKAQLEKAEADNAKLKTQVEESEKVIEDMQHSLDKKTAEKTTGGDYPTVKVDKKQYRIRVAGKIHFKGKDYTAADIQKNKQVAESLVKIKAAFMEEV